MPYEGHTLDGNIFVSTDTGEKWLPLYEAKMIHHYDHRWATYTPSGDTRLVTVEEKQDPNFVVMPRYWVPATEVDARLGDRWPHNWLLGFRRVARPTDERSAIFAVLPNAGAGDSVFLVRSLATPAMQLALLANLNSLAFDYVVRQKIGGINFNFYIVAQLPVLPPQGVWCPWNRSEALNDWIRSRVLELTYVECGLNDFAAELGHTDAPYCRHSERRFLLRCELDAAFFHLHDIERDDVCYIMDTFPIARRKDVATHGEYRTKRVVLEIYDAMTKAIAGREPYRTRLDPPAADASLRHSARNA